MQPCRLCLCVFLKVFIPLKPENIFCSKDKVLFSESIFVSERFVPLWLVLLVEVVLVWFPDIVILGKNSLLEIITFCFAASKDFLSAERKSLEAAKQNVIISRSEFLPSITISGNQTSTTSTNRTNQSGTNLSDTNIDSENKTLSLEQKIFSGFKGINTFKKTHRHNLHGCKVSY